MWCCPPENPTQDLVEFLKHVRFCGEKQGSVSWVPAGWDAQTRADQVHGQGQPRPGSGTEPSTLGLTLPETNTAPPPPFPAPVCPVLRIWGTQQLPPPDQDSSGLAGNLEGHR